MKALVNTEEKQRKTSRWVTGQSGNPLGRPPGTRNRVTLLAESLLNEQAENLVRRCIELAIQGNPMCIKLCLERILPPLKDKPVTVDLPPIADLKTVHPFLCGLINSVTKGEVTPQDGNVLVGLLATFVKIQETVDLDKRLRDLEQVLRLRKP